MLKTCVYCGRIHDASMNCPAKAASLKKQEEKKDGARKNRDEKADKFRHSGKWKQIREHVLHRDRRLCLCCLAGLEGTERRFETDTLSVHHIIPLKEDYNLRMDEGNLVTICAYHHELCEAGRIDRDIQRSLVEMSMQGTILSAYAEGNGVAEMKISPGGTGKK